MDQLLARRTERKTRRRAATRTAILDAARTWAAREGTGALSLRAVAAEAGYAPASVYEYFRNRAEMVLALAADDLGHVARLMKEAGAHKGSIATAASAALAAMRDSSALGAAMAALEAGGAPPESERLFNGKLIATLTALAEGAGRTPVKDKDGQADILLIGAAIAGLTLLSRSGRLKALGFEEQDLLDRLENRFA